MYQNFLKRFFDLIFSTLLLSLLFIPFAVIAICIKCDSRGPVFFKHKRAGKDLKPFTVYKFRTMKTSAPSNSPTNSLKDSNRYITRSGRIMRKLSLDELPQLVNVIKGDMSMVGPRPVVLNEEDLFAERAKYGANNCTPGITGWAQVNGRDELRVAEKAKMDGVYIKNFGFTMDVKCLLMTIAAVLSIKGHREGYEQDNEVGLPSSQNQGFVQVGREDLT